MGMREDVKFLGCLLDNGLATCGGLPLMQMNNIIWIAYSHGGPINRLWAR
jgi:hypothetical protein